MTTQNGTTPQDIVKQARKRLQKAELELRMAEQNLREAINRTNANKLHVKVHGNRVVALSSHNKHSK